LHQQRQGRYTYSGHGTLLVVLIPHAKLAAIALLSRVLVRHSCLQDYCTNNPDEISRVAGVQRKVDEVKNSKRNHPMSQDQHL
jgi:hypothetical protein